MTASLFASMVAFALASSITPGPVNIVALSSGATFGLRSSLRHVTGATVGFILVLILTGLGLQEALTRWPVLVEAVRWGGIAFLLYMALRLAMADGRVETDKPARGPSMMHGGVMQWLNPKAWMASVAGMGAFVGNGDAALLWQFVALYFVVCWLSIGSWATAGALLGRVLGAPERLRLLNRTLAALLALSALWLAVG